MSFLGMGPFEIIIILLVAFIFLGPERMADAARTLGKWTSELRRATAGVRAEMDDLIADDPTPPAQPAPPTRPTQTRPANADAPLPDETQPTAPIDPSAPQHRRRSCAQCRHRLRRPRPIPQRPRQSAVAHIDP